MSITVKPLAVAVKPLRARGIVCMEHGFILGVLVWPEHGRSAYWDHKDTCSKCACGTVDVEIRAVEETP